VLGALCLVFSAIQLTGVTGSDLRARAFFDANNVKVGDPLVLTVDFLGEADFASLHPPALSRVVDRKDWKLDDASAKTDTFRDARRLTYRIRPMREGLLWFPALEFEYAGTDGSVHMVRANEIPVHARVGAQVIVEEMSEDESEMPSPPELAREVSSCRLTDDELFRWRKALSQPTEEAFAEFDFPEARQNEASCAIRAGNWARALAIYTRLEWQTGQTPAIEQGIVAALALRNGSPRVELPIWRIALRPILRHSWVGRVGLVVGGFVLLALLLWLLNRGVRAVACLLLAVGMASSAGAHGLFEQMEEQMNRMHQQMQQSFGGFGLGGVVERTEPVKIGVGVTTDRKDLQVGAPFAFVIALEYPKTASVGQIRIVPSESFGLSFTSGAQNLKDGASSNPSNLVKRIALPARYDVPYRGKITFVVEGMVTGRQTQRGGMFTMSYSNSFRSQSNSVSVDVKPLSTVGQPLDFAGVISEGLRVHETCDRLTVGTNDVVTVTYRIFAKGFIPKDYLLPGAAFEWGRQTDDAGRTAEIEYRRFVVADGRKETPRVRISYYDPGTKSYRMAETGGTPLVYRAADGL